ncbi:MAG: tyrosine-type recombinase/integrase [Desulfobacteraceae bacterium]|nr:tyrosine-type recombinase/integrase [Desulfobacteraceae bacterium]
MKRFKSFLAEQMENFIEYRFQLGYSNTSMVYCLQLLDRYVLEKQVTWTSFDPFFFIRFRADLDLENRSINMSFRMIKIFFNYLIRKDLILKNPLQEITELQENQVIPFIFSPEETDLFLKAVIKLMRTSEKFYLSDFSAYIAFLLMARCGLRSSEPLNLLKTHYNPEERTIYIKKTKFRKDRLIPIPKTVAHEINNLLNVRRLFPDESHFLLVKVKGEKLVRMFINRRFKKALTFINLDQPRKIIGATNFSKPSHHSFAVNTLKRIKQQGKSCQNALPVLASYMGHSKYKYTIYYLKVLDAEHRRQMLDFSVRRSEDV